METTFDDKTINMVAYYKYINMHTLPHTKKVKGNI